MSLKDKLVSLLKNKNLNAIYALAGGLSEFWALAFGTSAIILEFKGKLEPNFAITITAITGILTLHDALDDIHSRKMRDRDGDDNGNKNPEKLGS